VVVAKAIVTRVKRNLASTSGIDVILSVGLSVEVLDGGTLDKGVEKNGITHLFKILEEVRRRRMEGIPPKRGRAQSAPQAAATPRV
jgi:hypothetical protein